MFQCFRFLLALFVVSGSHADWEEANLLLYETKYANDHQFETEVTRLMDIIINSLYSRKEVFLRELISNAADALEKQRFIELTTGETPNREKLNMHISFDKDNKIFTIVDSGVGMTKTELTENLGTIAKSGTLKFLEAFSQAGTDANLIGQFGVGFYSVYLVADKAVVISKNDNDDQYIWQSNAEGTFSVIKDPRGNTLKRGTKIILHFNDDSVSLLSEKALKDLIVTYSQFTSFSIFLQNKTEEIKAPSEPEEPSTEESAERWILVNPDKPIWLRPKDEISKEEYHHFYKAISKDYKEPLAFTHFVAEGEIEFKCILYIPTKDKNFLSPKDSNQKSIQLFVRRVLVSGEYNDLLPTWLSFVKGVVDSDDLPLKVDREQLAQKKILSVIEKRLVRKALELIRRLSKDEATARAELADGENEDDKEEIKNFKTFYTEFKQGMKYGCLDDDQNKEKIIRILRFYSLNHGKEELTIEKYIEEMAADQKAIYYISGSSLDGIRGNPSLQIFKKKQIDVLLLQDPLDEPCLSRMPEIDSFPLTSVEKGDTIFEEDEEDQVKIKAIEKLHKPLLDWWKTLLGERASKVVLSQRLVDDPVTVSVPTYGYSPHSEKILKAQGLYEPMLFGFMSSMKSLEVNPGHVLIKEMLRLVKEDPENAELRTMGEELFETGLLVAGFEPTHPSKMAAVIQRAIMTRLHVNTSEPLVVDVDIPQELIEEVKMERAKEGETAENDENWDDMEDFGFKPQPQSSHASDEL